MPPGSRSRGVVSGRSLPGGSNRYHRPRGPMTRARAGTTCARCLNAAAPVPSMDLGWAIDGTLLLLARPAAVVCMEELDLVLVARAVGLVSERERQPNVLELPPREVALDRSRLDAVDARTVEAENLRLHLRCQRRVSEPFLELAADVERAEGLDLVLRRAVEDAVR